MSDAADMLADLRFQPGGLPEPLLARLVERFDPEAVILFGSRARGQASQEADWACSCCCARHGTGRAFRSGLLLAGPTRGGTGCLCRRHSARVTDFAAERLRPATLASEANRDGTLVYRRR